MNRLLCKHALKWAKLADSILWAFEDTAVARLGVLYQGAFGL